MLKSDKDEALKSHPRLFMAYIAEWYKRCYTGDSSDSALPLTSVDLERLWGYSGIDIPTFVAVQADGTRRWLYSIYVLGGLASSTFPKTNSTQLSYSSVIDSTVLARS